MPPVISREHNQPLIFTAAPHWYQWRASPCEINCPAGNAIQRTISLIEKNEFERALEGIRATNPFPGLTGRVCFYPCETACNRGQYDERIGFRALERAIFDHARRDRVIKPKKMAGTGKSVAIVGSGPAGLTCSYFLSLLGHRVVLFEASASLGGMPRIVPKHRLPQDVIDSEIADIVELGIDVRTNTNVGKDISLEEIIGRYDACLVATGAWQSMTLDIPGKELAMVGLAFLSAASSGTLPRVGERVVVVGSGGTAFDCASVALRAGAKKVHVAALESREQMLAPLDEVARGEAEGLVIHNSKTLTRLLSEDGQVAGIECLDVAAFSFDGQGRAHIESLRGTEQVIAADTVIFAVGQRPDIGFTGEAKGLQISGLPMVAVNPLTLETGREGVFAAGDAATGPKSIVEAIGGGRRAAVSIHRYLTMKGSREHMRSISLAPDGTLCIETARYEEEKSPQYVVKYDRLANVEFFEKKPRVQMRSIPALESLRGFDEVHRGYTKGEAIEEASRCFHCGHCFKCTTCVEVCPEDVFAMTEDGVQIVYPDECFTCGACVMDCPCSAITMRLPAPMRLAALRG